MASVSEPKKQEWLIIAPDHPNVLEKRLEVRPKHLEGIKPEPDFWLMGGAMLSEPLKEGEEAKMIGSVMVVWASSEQEVRERIQRDPYVTGGVWDYDKLKIYPFRSAIRKAL